MTKESTTCTTSSKNWKASAPPRAWAVAKNALPHFQRAVELEPASAQLLNNMAGALAASGRFTEAMQYVRRALAIDPNYGPALDNLRRLQGMGIR